MVKSNNPILRIVSNCYSPGAEGGKNVPPVGLY